jgi:mutator protein MutT
MDEATGLKRVRVAIGIVVAGDQILICRRRANDSFGGFWEFPGGKCEAGETPEDCVRRELMEELAITVSPVRGLTSIEHRYPQSLVTLYPFLCRLDSGEPRPLSASEFRWVAPASLREFRFPLANAGLLKTLAATGFVGGGIDLRVAEP